MSPAELQKLPGFGRDIEKSRAEAKRLLAEAGFPNGLKFVLKNRNVKLPYQDFAVFVIQEWKKIGVEATNRPLETAAWFDDGRDSRNFEADRRPARRVHGRSRPVPGGTSIAAVPDELGPGSPTLRLDDLFERQARALDPAERKKLVNQYREDRVREGVLHARALVGAKHRALGQAEKLDGAAQPLLQPEAAGRLARRRLIGEAIRHAHVHPQAPAVDGPDPARGRHHGVPDHARDPRGRRPPDPRG